MENQHKHNTLVLLDSITISIIQNVSSRRLHIATAGLISMKGLRHSLRISPVICFESQHSLKCLRVEVRGIEDSCCWLQMGTNVWNVPYENCSPFRSTCNELSQTYSQHWSFHYTYVLFDFEGNSRRDKTWGWASNCIALLQLLKPYNYKCNPIPFFIHPIRRTFCLKIPQGFEYSILYAVSIQKCQRFNKI